MTAETVAKALGGHKSGSAWMALCPAHEDREPSLSITDADNGKVLVRWHAGCEQEQVIAALRSRGLWTESGSHRFTRFAPRAVATSQPDRAAADAPLPCGAETSFGRHLAGDGRASDARVRRHAACDPPYLPRPRR